MYNDELYHYGVFGMKWGIRKTQEQLARERRNLGGETSYELARARYGNRGVSRISNRIDEGNTISEAIKKENTRQKAIKVASSIAGTVVSIAIPIAIFKSASTILPSLMPMLVSKLMTPETISTGQKAVETIMSNDAFMSIMMSPEIMNTSQNIAKQIMEQK